MTTDITLLLYFSPFLLFTQQKLYTVCDISLGLLLSRCINPTIKEYPVDVKLPKTLFTSAPSDFRNPDFKQLINIGSESEAQTGTSITNPPLEMSIKNKVQPILQFTPNKHTKAFKEGLIPPELVKPKGVNTSKPRYLVNYFYTILVIGNGQNNNIVPSYGHIFSLR